MHPLGAGRSPTDELGKKRRMTQFILRPPGFRLRGSFLAVTPKKNQKNASRTIGCDIVKYAKTWLFRINTYLRAKGDRNECIFYF